MTLAHLSLLLTWLSPAFPVAAFDRPFEPVAIGKRADWEGGRGSLRVIQVGTSTSRHVDK